MLQWLAGRERILVDARSSSSSRGDRGVLTHRQTSARLAVGRDLDAERGGQSPTSGDVPCCFGRRIPEQGVPRSSLSPIGASEVVSTPPAAATSYRPAAIPSAAAMAACGPVPQALQIECRGVKGESLPLGRSPHQVGSLGCVWARHRR